jgi:serine/threonine protein kinase
MHVILKRLVKAIQICHKNHIAHTDIKLENIGVRQSIEDLCLLDFNSAVVIKPNFIYTTRTLRGTRGYTAPEVLHQPTLSDEDLLKIDYWQLGVTLYHLLEDTPAFHRDVDIANISYKWKRYKGPFRSFVEALLCEKEKRLQLDDVDDIDSLLNNYTNK